MIRKLIACTTMALCVLTLSVIVLQQVEAQGNIVTLQDAVARKLVNVKLAGTDDLFFRQSAAYQIQNVSGGDIVLGSATITATR